MIRIVAPGSDATLIRAVERAITEAQRLDEYATADLPPAADHRAKQVLVTDISMVAVSNGTAWIRLDTGATL